MRYTLLAFILVLATAGAVQAGAWLRSEGGGFASSSVTRNRDNELSTSIYLEYGLSATRTLGADISYGFDRTGIQEGSGILFLRLPVGATDQTDKIAVQFGLGARVLNGQYLPAAEIGLSWGRGIQIGEKWGWLGIDSSLNLTRAPAENRIKIDGTAGLGISAQSKIMLQVFNTFQNGETYTKIAPSFLFQPGKGKTTLQLGAEIPVTGGGSMALRVGVWREW